MLAAPVLRGVFYTESTSAAAAAAVRARSLLYLSFHLMFPITKRQASIFFILIFMANVYSQ
jgi:hypothetical protein